MLKYLKLMRIHHYIKNILIFLPVVFSGQLFSGNNFFKTLMGFIIFSLLSSTVYILNDVRDRERDRKHNVKCNRPIASGDISVKSAWIFFSILCVVILVLIYFFIGPNFWAIVYLGSYFLLNLIYSFGGKDIPILDIGILAAGFLLRVLFGASILYIDVSVWLYLTIIAVSFYLSLGKRRNELTRQIEGTRKVLKYYSKGFLNNNMYMCLALSITFYALWTINPLTVTRMGSNALIWTVPLVILICIKYSLDIEGNSEGDPVEIILRDKILLALVGLLGLIILGIIYLPY